MTDGLPNFEQYDILRKLRESEHIFDLVTHAKGSGLQRQKELRRQFPAEMVRAALTLHRLRLRAQAKFSRANQMWFDQTRLEQSTSETVARHKAGRFKEAGRANGIVWDYCCGIGADSMAIAEHVDVVAVDRDPAACLSSSWNADVYGVSSRMHPVCADVEQQTSRTGLLHIDPDRRPHRAGRVVRVEDSVPDLEFLERLTREFRGGAIKLSPAGNFAGKFRDVEIELISLSGECKEATIWFGELATAHLWRATLLPSGATLAGDPLEAMAEVGPLGSYLFDPDPAIVRAGLVDVLAEQTGLRRLDDAEEYLTADTRVESPFARSFEVLDELPNNDRTIRRYLQNANIGRLEIKCRHIPIQAETVRRKMRLKGDEEGVLVFARIADKARAVICRRLMH